MAEYTPLMSAPQDDDEIETKKQVEELSPRYVLLFSVLVALMAIAAAAAAFHLSVLGETHETPRLLRPKDIEATLRMAHPSPNLEKGHAIMVNKKFKCASGSKSIEPRAELPFYTVPRMVFPMFIARANAAAPDELYKSGAAVVLSPTVSVDQSFASNLNLTSLLQGLDDLPLADKQYLAKVLSDSLGFLVRGAISWPQKLYLRWRCHGPRNMESQHSREPQIAGNHELERAPGAGLPLRHRQLHESRGAESAGVSGCPGDQCPHASFRLSRGH